MSAWNRDSPEALAQVRKLRIDELEERIGELETRELGYILSLREMKATIAELREAARAVERENSDGSISDWNPELSIALDALAALLEQSSETD